MFSGKKIIQYSSRAILDNHISEFVFDTFIRKQAHNFIYIAPGQHRIKNLRKRIIKIMPEHTLPVFQFLTFGKFIQSLASIMPSIPAVAPPSYIRLILQEAFKENNELKILNKYKEKNFTGFIDFASNFRESIINSEHSFTTNSPPFGMDSLLWNDLRSIENTLQNILKRIGLSDKANRDLEILNKLNLEIFNQAFPGVDTIIYESEAPLSSIHLKILSKIFIDIKNVFVLFRHYDDSHVFISGNKTFDHFHSLGIFEILKQNSDQNKFNIHCAENLFSPSPEINNEVSKIAEQRIAIFSLGDETSESDDIARIIKRELINNPLSLSEIAVASVEPAKYFPLLESFLKRYGIPYSIEIPIPLMRSPLISFFLKVLNAINDNYHLNSIKHIFDYPFMLKKSIKPSNTEPPTDEKNLLQESSNFTTDILNEISSSTGIIEGRDNWLRELKKNIHIIEEAIKVYSIQNLNDEEENEKNKKRLDSLNHTLNFLNAFFDRSKVFEKKLLPMEFKQELLNFLFFIRFPNLKITLPEDFNNPDISFSNPDLVSVERDSKSYNRLIRLINEITFAADQIVKGKQSLGFYINLLQNKITGESFHYTQRPISGVKLIDIKNISEYKIKILFIAGMDFNRIPSKIQNNPFALYGETDPALGQIPESERTASQRIAFFKMLTQPEERVVFTYSSGAENEILPSPFIDELRNLYNLKIQEEISPEYKIPVHVSDLINELINCPDKVKITRELNNLGIREISNLRHAIRAINAEYINDSAPLNSEYNGIIHDPIQNNSINRRFQSHDFSATELERYTGCPFSFFLQKVLAISEPEIIEEEFSPMQRGNIIHNSICNYYTTLRNSTIPNSDTDNTIRNRKIPNLKPTKSDFSKKLSLLLKIAENEIKKTKPSDFFGRKTMDLYLASKEANGYSGIFEIFLQSEMEDKNKIIPFLFEVVFGRQSFRGAEDPFSDRTPVTIDNTPPGIKITGRIDRIDFTENGEVFIMDYKTGSGGRVDEIESGLNFQIPLYIFAINELMKRKLSSDSYICIGSCYYRIGIDKRECKKDQYLINVESKEDGTIPIRGGQTGILPSNSIAFSLEELIERSIRRAGLVVEKIRSGIFPALYPDLSDLDKGIEWDRTQCPPGCGEYCTFKNICRSKLK